MFAAFQILSFERSGIADQLHKKHLSPIRPEVTNVPKQKTYRPFYRGSPFERPCRVADTKRLCFRTTFRPVSTLRQSVLDFALPHTARPSLRRAEGTLRTPDFRLRTIRPTFIFRPLRINSSRPENKKGCKRTFATQPTTRSFAERRGFEPLIRFRRIRAFQARLFNHSSTSPRMGKDNDFSGNRPNFAPTNSPSGTIFSGHCRQKTLPHASEPGQTAFIPPGSRPFAVRQKAACLIAEERPARNRPYPKTNLQAQTV